VEVTKIFHFEAAHRLLNYEGKCKHIHGHTYVAEITIEASALDDKEMVVDFGELKEKIGKWLDRHWDHALLLHSADPLVGVMKKVIEDSRMYLFDTNPTAEAMADILYEVANDDFNEPMRQLSVKSVKIWETPTSYAEYSG
jgi:6-pyruvoyltetrahydropterin/6-carboxytetrahydropterin synthase